MIIERDLSWPLFTAAFDAVSESRPLLQLPDRSVYTQLRHTIAEVALVFSLFSRVPCAPVAQRLEQQTHNLLVRGSNPCGGTK